MGSNTGDLLHVKRKVVAEHAGGLLGGDFGHHRDIVEYGGNVVEQCEQAGGQVESRREVYAVRNTADARHGMDASRPTPRSDSG